MPTAVERVVQSLRIRSLGQDATTQPDRRLLEAFSATGDESAFAELVRRHGPLVLGVCRRILGNVQDAEDAFQATFLVLARKAGAVPWRDSIKNWLHGVACRVAMKARSRAIQRKQKEQEIEAKTPAPDAPAAAWSELRAVLDAELEQLPDKYRAVLILCYLEGKTRDEAADTLGWSVGAVKGCLERGREMLRGRLSKRGLTLSAALVTGLMADALIVSAPLSAATVQSACAFLAGSATVAPSVVSLAQGALNAMLLTKIKTMGLVTMMVLLGVGSFVGVQVAADRPAGNAVAAAAPVPQDKEKKPGELKKGDEARRDEPFGLVKAIDLKLGTITITPLRDGGGDEQAYSLGAKDLTVSTTFGEPLKLAEIVVGMRVHLQLKGLDVMALRVENPVVPASLTEINVEKGVVHARAERMLATYSIVKDAKITVAGKPAKLAEVPLEARLFLTLSIDKKTILAIHTPKNVERRPVGDQPKEGERPKGDRPVERPIDRVAPTNATIIDIDAGKGTATLLMGRDADVKFKMVNLGQDYKVKVMFDERVVQELTMAQLTKPLSVTVQFSEVGGRVSSLTVPAPITRAAVKSIDVANKKITITGENREDKTYDIDPAAVIRLAGRGEGKLADVNPATNVLLGFSLDRQRVVGLTVIAPTRRDGDR